MIGYLTSSRSMVLYAKSRKIDQEMEEQTVIMLKVKPKI